MPFNKETRAQYTSHLLSRKGRRVTAPLLYSDKLVDKMCDLIIQGVPTNRICRLKGMPSRTTVGRWLRKYPEFAERFIEAKQIQTYFNADDIREIAESCSEDSTASVQKAKLLVDVIKWESSRLLPRIWGDKSSIDIRREEEASPDRLAKIVTDVVEKLRAKALPAPSEDIIDAEFK